MSTGGRIPRAHSTVASLRLNLPNDYEVGELRVRQFNDALDKVETAFNISLDDFKVATSMLYRAVGSRNYITGEVNYRDGLWCRQQVLMHKIDSVPGYFTGLQNDRDRQIGFRRS